VKTLLLIAALVAGVSTAARADELGTLVGRWPVGSVEEISVEFPVGELALEASDDTEIRAELSVRCRHSYRSCVERSRRLKLVTQVAGRTRQIRLEGLPKFGSHGLEVRLTIAVPKTLGVNAEMGVGDCRVEGLVRDVRVELGVGDVTLLAKESDVKSVHLTVGIGDATLHHGSHAQAVSGLLGRKVRWSDGPGASHVSVELGVGDIDVRLD
jgi:hypothetical protein